MTTYTSNLGLALPATGDLTGTWGQTVNDAITTLLDSAVAGTTTLSADADVTLTDTTGAANQSRQAIIRWTAGGTVTRNITAPARTKVYVVINATSGSQSIVFRGAGPTTGVTLIAGERAVLAWSGTDFVRVSAGAGGSANQVQYNSGGGLAGSANLTFDGTTLTAANFADSSLTSGRVVYAGTSGNLTDNIGFTFNGTVLTAPSITSRLKAYSEEVTTVTVSTSTHNLDTSVTNIFDVTLSTNVTFTFTNPPSSGTARPVTVILRQDGSGNRTASFTNAKYSDGIVPVLSTGANQVDVLTFFTVNGGSFWFGTLAMSNVS